MVSKKENCDGDETLYRINIKTPASPQEVFDFTEMLEANDYTVATDLQSGTIEVRE
jgi:hypothetical protein